MRIPNAVHESRPWRIRQIASDFELEDVWALPAHGKAEDFPKLLELMASLDPTKGNSLPARALWFVRDLLGRWFDLGKIQTEGGAPDDVLPIPGTNETTLRSRLPDDLRGTVDRSDSGGLPFVPLYRTDTEFASEISNRTVHGVLHLGWADEGGGRYQGQMAVYVKPRGPFGQAYMTLIRPFRYGIVYPALMRQIERGWNARARPAEQDSSHTAATAPR